MAKLELQSADNVSSVTLELAMELQQEKPDRNLVTWLINDMEADLTHAMMRAHLEEEDLLKKPQLRALHLQKYLRK
ncbi:MAG: hypothetical protein HY052_07985 [Proteobacteria bacterium]|nr:hypothetical protein [Pseudomonadota bacterium]